MAAIARHNSINEGGGNIATLNGDRINISPDNIQKPNRCLPETKRRKGGEFSVNSNRKLSQILIQYLSTFARSVLSVVHFTEKMFEISYDFYISTASK